MNVYSGSVRRLEVTIPWTALAAQPVKVRVVGVNLLVGPLTSSQMTETSAKQRFAESKARAIAIADHKHLLFLEAKKRQAEMVRQKGEGHASPGKRNSMRSRSGSEVSKISAL